MSVYAFAVWEGTGRGWAFKNVLYCYSGTVEGRLSRGERHDQVAGHQLVRGRNPKGLEARPGNARVRRGRTPLVRRAVEGRQEARARSDGLRTRRVGRRVELRRPLGGRPAARLRDRRLARRHAVHRRLGTWSAARTWQDDVAGKRREYGIIIISSVGATLGYFQL